MELHIDASNLSRHSRGGDGEALESWVHIMHIARAFEEAGDIKMAEEFFRTALWISDEFLSAETSMKGLLMLSSTLSKEGRNTEAALAFMRALRMFDENINN
jgi:tetratricopeptide (TPR) repeat protein